eukprot:TRINITY_DN49036_c0_g1_i1.p1 TRINITY_DN49036_c0_g1~~TRINITY_DN49036_c0_g1_i1.p1  ORF type:complete len:333 (+),score=4.01 TRINITY_DN49036_c0_g1_i1:19-1017(+)
MPPRLDLSAPFIQYNVPQFLDFETLLYASLLCSTWRAGCRTEIIQRLRQTRSKFPALSKTTKNSRETSLFLLLQHLLSRPEAHCTCLHSLELQLPDNCSAPEKFKTGFGAMCISIQRINNPDKPLTTILHFVGWAPHAPDSDEHVVLQLSFDIEAQTVSWRLGTRALIWSFNPPNALLANPQHSFSAYYVKESSTPDVYRTLKCSLDQAKPVAGKHTTTVHQQLEYLLCNGPDVFEEKAVGMVEKFHKFAQQLLVGATSVYRKEAEMTTMVTPKGVADYATGDFLWPEVPLKTVQASLERVVHAEVSYIKRHKTNLQNLLATLVPWPILVSW